MGKVYPVTLAAEMQRRGGGTRSVNNNMELLKQVTAAATGITFKDCQQNQSLAKNSF